MLDARGAQLALHEREHGGELREDHRFLGAAGAPRRHVLLLVGAQLREQALDLGARNHVLRVGALVMGCLTEPQEVAASRSAHNDTTSKNPALT